MPDKYEQILEVIAENPGSTVEEITDLAVDYGVIEAAVVDLLSTAVSNDVLVVFNDRYWVMRTGEYRFNRYDHPKT